MTLCELAARLPFVVDPAGLPPAQRGGSPEQRYRSSDTTGPRKAVLMAKARREAEAQLRPLVTPGDRMRLLAACSISQKGAEEFETTAAAGQKPGS